MRSGPDDTSILEPGFPAYAAAAALVGRELTVPLVTQSVVLTRTRARSTAMPAFSKSAWAVSASPVLKLHWSSTTITCFGCSSATARTRSYHPTSWDVFCRPFPARTT